MLIGQSIFLPVGASSQEVQPIYGPWMPRGGDAAVFAVQVIAISSGNGEITPVVEHKNTEDADPGSVAATFSTASTRTTVTQEATGLKELVRLRFDVVHVDEEPGWAHIRVMPPMWLPN